MAFKVIYRGKVYNLGPNEIIILRILNKNPNKYFGNYGIGTSGRNEGITKIISKTGKIYSISGHYDSNKAKRTFEQLERKKLVNIKETYPGMRINLEAKITNLGYQVLGKYESPK